MEEFHKGHPATYVFDFLRNHYSVASVRAVSRLNTT